MENYNQTIVQWKFSLDPINCPSDERVFVKPYGKNKTLILGDITIASMPTSPVLGRHFTFSISGIEEEGGRRFETNDFLRMRIHPMNLKGREIIRNFEEDIYNSKLLKGEEFLEGALQMGELILEILNARSPSGFHTRNTMLKRLSIIQKTFVWYAVYPWKGGSWVPLEIHLARERGWRV